MRGKFQPERDVQDAARITPAYAGKSWRASKKPPGSSDHPRACGEKAGLWYTLYAKRGSPPRMQGKDIFPDGLPCAVRITPACAGKSRSQPRLPCTGRDHPRVCGEKLRIVEVGRVKEGSPPRVRGKGRPAQGGTPATGITPAHAGKRFYAIYDKLASRDHPRACGEKLYSICAPAPIAGSPPRMRGKGAAVAVIAK